MFVFSTPRRLGVELGKSVVYQESNSGKAAKVPLSISHILPTLSDPHRFKQPWIHVFNFEGPSEDNFK